jgi:hypothetical protein
MIFSCSLVKEDLVTVKIDWGNVEFDDAMREAIANLHLTLLSTFDPNGVTVVTELLLPALERELKQLSTYHDVNKKTLDLLWEIIKTAGLSVRQYVKFVGVKH